MPNDIASLQVGEQLIKADEILPLLRKYHLLSPLLRELVIDQAIAPFSCTPQEVQAATQALQAQDIKHAEGLPTHEATSKPLEVPRERLIRNLRIEKFKQATWGPQIEPYFLQRKAQLDKAVYWLIRTPDHGLAQELYFRLQAKEQTFAELASVYSQGPEVHTKGLVGPVELGKLHPALAKRLVGGLSGQLWPPLPLGNWWVIVQLEQLIPVQLDEIMRQRLVQELFERWLQTQLQQILTEEQNGQELRSWSENEAGSR